MAQKEIDFLINAKLNKAGFNELKNEIQSLRALSERDLINIGSAKSFEDAKVQLKVIQNSATQVEAALNKAFSVKLGTVSLSKFNNELKGLNLKEIAADFSKAGAVGTAAFNNLTASVLTTKNQVKEANRWLDEMGKTMTNTIKWGVSSSAWNTMTGAFQKAYDYVKDLDRSLNDIRIVSEKSADEMARFAVQANRAAKNLGATTLDYTNAALIYYQQGLSEAEVAERTNTTIKLANTLQVSAGEVSDYMTAIWNNFYDGSKSIEYYADVLAKLGAATASSAQEISTGLEKFAAIADTVGLSYEYATSALTTITATTRQSAEVVGTALKTLFARIQDLELGDTLDDGTTLGKYSEALNKIGVDIKTSNGELKGMDDILDEMGDKWSTLTKAQQVSLAQTVAGNRQYTQLVALMDNWSDFENNLSMAASATGELNKQQDIYLESTQAHLDKLNASAERLYSNLIDSDGFNNLIDMFSTLVTGVSEYTEAIGGSKAALSQIGALATKAFGRTVSQSIATAVSNFKKLNEQAEDFNAQTVLLRQFKGIEINSVGYQKMLDMITALNNYKDILSETQIQEANTVIMEYNQAANERDAWIEAKQYATDYYNLITTKDVNLDANFNTEQLENYEKIIDEKTNEYQRRIGQSQKEITSALDDYDAYEIEEYINSAEQMLEQKLVQNERVAEQLQKILVAFNEAGAYDDQGVLSDEQKDSLKDFAKIYGEAADLITKNSKKVKQTFKDAMAGMEDSTKSATKEISQTWDELIDKFNTQALSQNIMNLSSEIMMISSAIDSIKSVPNIWSNENLSWGEKVFQTLIAVGNAATGVVQAYKLINTTATLLTPIVESNAAAYAMSAGAQKLNAEGIIKGTEVTKEYKKEVEDTNKALINNTAADLYQQEIAETGKNIVQTSAAIQENTEKILTNTDAINAQTKAYMIARAERSKYTEELAQDLMDSADILYDQDKIKITKKSVNYKEAANQFEQIKIKPTEENAEKLIPKESVQLKLDLDFSEPVKESTTEVWKAEEAIKDLGKTGKKSIGENLKKNFSTIGKAIEKIPPQAYIAVAAIAAIYTIWSVATAEERHLNEEVEKTAQAVEKVKEAYESLNTSISSYQKSHSAIEDLTEDTIEFYKAIEAANEEAFKLIETLGLISGIDYTMDEHGLITIDENVLERELFKELQNVYRTQADNFTAKANLEEFNQRKIIKNFQAEINKASIKQGVNAELSYDQAKQILEKGQKDLGQIGFTTSPYFNRYNQNTQSLIPNAQSLIPSETIEGSTQQICEAIDQNSVDISSVIETYLPQYNTSQARIENYEKQAALLDFKSYASQDQLKELGELSSGSLSAVSSILASAKESPAAIAKKELADKALGWGSYDDWYDFINPARWGSSLGVQISGVKDIFREAYAKNVYGYEKNNETGIWVDPNTGKDVSKEVKKIDWKEAAKAYGSGEYSTVSTYENTIQPILKSADTLSQGMSSTSKSYIEEALLRLQAGEMTDEFANLLSNEEKQTLMNNVTYGDDLYIGDAAVADTYSSSQITEWLQVSEEADRSIERMRKDLEAYNAEISSSAEALGTTASALKLYADAMYNADGQVNDFTADTAKAAAEEYKFNKAYNASRQIFEDNEDAFNIYVKALKTGKKVSSDVADAAGELVDSLAEMGIVLKSDDLKSDKVLKNIKTLLNGTEEEAEAAYEVLYELSQLNVLKNFFGDSTDLLSKYQTIVNGINSTEIGKNLTGTAQQELANLLTSANLTAAQVAELGKSLNITIPVTLDESKAELALENKEFTTAAQSIQHRYKGTMIIPNAQGGYEEANVDYSWIETVEEKTDSFLVPKTTDITVNKNKTNSGGNFTKGATSGGKGSSSKPKKEEKIEDKPDRYHDVDVELKQLSNSMEKLTSQEEKFVGQSKIDNLTKQFKVLNAEIETTNRKIDIAKGEMNELQGTLSKQGVMFTADGTIANYAAVYQSQVDTVNAIIDKYNSMSTQQQEKYQETLDKAKKDFEKFKEDLSRYDEVITDLIPGLEQDIQDAIDEQIEKKIEAFNMEIKIRLDMAEAERDWNEFKRNVIDGIKDDDILGTAKSRLQDFYSYYKDDATGAVQATTKQINALLDQLKQQETQTNASAYGNDRAQALEDLKEYYNQLTSDLTSVLELSEEIREAYGQMMDEANEKFSDQIAAYQQVSDLIQHDMNIISLVYGEESYSALSKFYNRQEENNNKQLDFQRQQVNFWANQMTLLDESSEEWETAKDNWMSAVSKWNSLVESSIDNLQAKYLNVINEIFQRLNNQVTNGLGLAYTNEQWNLINQNADQYLDSVNAIYSVQQLQNKYLEAIDSYDSVSAQAKLNDLMEQEIGYLQEQDKLSQYDIDRAELKYQIALKQIALEEAQQNKTSMRLRRDSQGNYSYQYVADQDQTSKIQQEISNLYNQLYNLDADQYKSNLDELYNVWAEFQEKMTEAAQINDPEKRAQRELLIKEQYGDLINALTEKNENLQANLYNSTMSHLFDLYSQNNENYAMMTDQQQAILDQYITAETDLHTAAFDNLFNLYNQNLEAFNNMSIAEQDVLMNSIVPQWNSALQEMVDTIIGEGGFEEVCRQAFEDLDIATKNYETGLQELQESAGKSFEEIQNGIDSTILSTQELVSENDTLISKYEDQLKAIQEVILEMDTLIQKYKDAEKAAKDATQAAYEYQQRENAKNANIDTNLDTKTGEDNSNPVESAPAQPVASEEPSKPSLTKGSYVDVKSGTRWYADSYGGGASGYARSGKIKFINLNGSYPYNIDGLGWIKKSGIVGYATGGYTGDWANSEGKLAMLHKKELVLNAGDTENMLNAISIVRDITANLNAGLLERLAGITAGVFNAHNQGDILEQSVHITADFPNVTNAKEIEDALNNLVNRASQEIHKR